MTFEWDERKNQLNIQKHGVSFDEAQVAFFDERRIILCDEKHSEDERRYFCLGKCMRGERVNEDMNKKTVYRNAPDDVSEALLKGEIVEDFLPSPEQLVKRIPKVKVTISLNRQSVEFFKRSAEKNNVKYQTMINELLDKYVEKYRDREE